jgi:hypothetical protein
VGPFSFGDGAFDNHVIDLSIVVSLLSLIVKVGIRASGNGEDCVVGWKVVTLLQRLAEMGKGVGSWFVLLGCVVWHWIGNLWN